jgi:NCS1 family nucleobase:cation symporter-1
MMLVDYFVIRKRKLVIPDLFIGDDSSIYWYTKGFNWRAIAALLLAMWISIRTCPFAAELRRRIH